MNKIEFFKVLYRYEVPHCKYCMIIYKNDDGQIGDCPEKFLKTRKLNPDRCPYL